MELNPQLQAEVDDSPLQLREKQLIFLEAVRAGASYAEAADIAEVNKATQWRWRQNPEFAKLLGVARDISVEQLIKEAERRALRGSDKMLEFLLCNYAPEKFKKAQSLALSGSLDLANKTEAELREELAALSSVIHAAPPQDDGSDLV